MTKLKIYFAGSIRGGRDDVKMYKQIIKLLQSYGNVLTEHVGDKNISATGEDGPNDEYIYKRDTNWLKECDVVVAEVTSPSLGVGYELALAKSKRKKTLCLFRPSEGKKLSAMIGGNSYFKVVNYKKPKDLKVILNNFF